MAADCRVRKMILDMRKLISFVMVSPIFVSVDEKVL